MTGRTVTRRPGRKLVAYDRKLGARLVAGVDEVGRGCLAGPLVAAAVVFDYQVLVGPVVAPLGHLDDSKKLTPVERERLYNSVLAVAAAWSVVVVSPTTIDRVGLHVSNLRALHDALARLRGPIDIALVDGFPLRQQPGNVDTCHHVVGGDTTSASIAAASVVAKVTRDRLMCRLDDRLGGRWAFADHMGYATELHHERIALHGISDLHRRSFDSIAYRRLGSERIADVIDALDPTAAVAIHQKDIEAVVLNPAL